MGAAKVFFNDPDATLTAAGVPGCPGAPAIIAGDCAYGGP